MADPVGLTSLVYEVSKDLYTYYRAIKQCDADIKELRAQLLWLQQASDAVAKALKRDGIKAEDTTKVHEATSRCTQSAEALKTALDRIKDENTQPQKAVEKLKALGRKAVYPFKKRTIAGLTEDVETCQDALRDALVVLQLDVSASTIEQLQKLDDKLVDGVATLEGALQDLKFSGDSARRDIVQQLQHHRKMLEDEKVLRKARAVVKGLEYPEMFQRRHNISDADYDTLDWLFTAESQEHLQLTHLLNFLRAESGLFWIQGKPASGKSTFMKYLLDRTRGNDKRWEWSGTKQVVFASHFCWIAGTSMQRSLQGLLQSLLYQVLDSDLAIVPIACASRWADHRRATSAYAFFIDGLDEIEPDACHLAVSKAIYQLSCYTNVKILISSRPWPDFESNLHQGGKTVTMEKINRRSIMAYVRNRLLASEKDSMFAFVSWDCIYRGYCPTKLRHMHDDAHDMAHNIMTRAEGVFLWVALVMNAVCRHATLGCPVAVLKIYVDRLPGELEIYFHDMVFRRIDGSLLSETAMMIVVALALHLRGNTLSSFSLLCDYTATGESRLVEPDFLVNLPYSTITANELRSKARKTMNLVRGCCKDIFTFVHPSEDSVSDEELLWVFYRARIGFTHRSMFDHFHTPKWQNLLEAHVPTHFQDRHFGAKMLVASWKVIPSDSAFDHQSSVQMLHHCVDDLRHCLHRWQSRIERDLAELVEKTALHALKFHTLVCDADAYAVYDQLVAENHLRDLSSVLSLYDLYSLTDTVLWNYPRLVSLCRAAEMGLGIQDSGLNTNYINNTLLRKLLDAGANPNAALWAPFEGAYSPWREVLGHLFANPKSGFEYNKPVGMAFLEEVNTDCDDLTREQRFSDRQVQTAIKLLIEYGAYLDAKIIHRLLAFLPTDNEFQWPSFLDTYATLEMRQKLLAERRRRISGWPEKAWTNDDRRLLGLARLQDDPIWPGHIDEYDAAFDDFYGYDEFDLRYEAMQMKDYGSGANLCWGEDVTERYVQEIDVFSFSGSDEYSDSDEPYDSN